MHISVYGCFYLMVPWQNDAEFDIDNHRDMYEERLLN